MTKISLNDKLFGAIFGPKDEAEKLQWEQEAAQAKAEQKLRDKAKALELVKLAQENCCFGKYAEAQWIPALLWGNPVAIAIQEDSKVLLAYPEVESVTTLTEIDIENCEVFNES